MLGRRRPGAIICFTKRLSSEFSVSSSVGRSSCFRGRLDKQRSAGRRAQGRPNTIRSAERKTVNLGVARSTTHRWAPSSAATAWHVPGVRVAPRHFQTMNQRARPRPLSKNQIYNKNNLTSSLHRFIGKSGYV